MTESMRIGLLCLNYGRGGVGVHVESLAHQLLAVGHDAYIFAGRDLSSSGESESGPRIIDLGLQMRHGFPSIWSSALRRALLRNHVPILAELDVLIGNPVSGDLARWAGRLSVAYLTTLHGCLRSRLTVERGSHPTNFSLRARLDRLYKRIDSQIEKREYLSSDAVTAVSPSVLREYEALWGMRPEAHVIPPCARPEFFDCDGGDEDGERFLLDGSSKWVLFVGTSLPVKGFRYMVRAFAILARQREDVRLAIVSGQGDDIVRRLVRNFGIANRSVSLPRVTALQMASLMSAADVLAAPSLYEGCPLVTIEAMSRALPVVGFETTGLTDTIHDGQTGYKVPLGDVTAFAAALRAIIDNDDLRRRMGVAGSTHAHRFYHPRRVGKEYDRVLRRLA